MELGMAANLLITVLGIALGYGALKGKLEQKVLFLEKSVHENHKDIKGLPDKYVSMNVMNRLYDEIKELRKDIKELSALVSRTKK